MPFNLPVPRPFKRKLDDRFAPDAQIPKSTSINSPGNLCRRLLRLPPRTSNNPSTPQDESCSPVPGFSASSPRPENNPTSTPEDSISQDCLESTRCPLERTFSRNSGLWLSSHEPPYDNGTPQEGISQIYPESSRCHLLHTLSRDSGQWFANDLPRISGSPQRRRPTLRRVPSVESLRGVVRRESGSPRSRAEEPDEPKGRTAAELPRSRVIDEEAVRYASSSDLGLLNRTSLRFRNNGSPNGIGTHQPAGTTYHHGVPVLPSRSAAASTVASDSSSDSRLWIRAHYALAAVPLSYRSVGADYSAAQNSNEKINMDAEDNSNVRANVDAEDMPSSHERIPSGKPSPIPESDARSPPPLTYEESERQEDDDDDDDDDNNEDVENELAVRPSEIEDGNSQQPSVQSPRATGEYRRDHDSGIQEDFETAEFWLVDFARRERSSLGLS